MEMQEQEFIKAFNVGYQLSKRDPSLLNQLLTGDNQTNEYFKAMLLGKQEHDRERVIEKMKQAGAKSKEKGKENER